jgi:hypothetical protein
VAFLPIALRHLADAADVLFEFCLGFLDVCTEQPADVPKLPGDELPDSPYLG